MQNEKEPQTKQQKQKDKSWRTTIQRVEWKAENFIWSADQLDNASQKDQQSH